MADIRELGERERQAWAIEVSDEGYWEFPVLDPRDPFAAAAPAHFSRRLRELLGEQAPPVIGSLADAVHPDDRARVEAERRAQLDAPGVVQAREYRVAVGGEVRWWSERSEVRAADGGLRMLGLVRDVTEVRRTVATMQRHAELLRQTQAAATVGGWEIDMVTGELFWTAETHRIHEVPPGFKPVLETAINFYAPEHVPLITAAVQRAQEGEPFDVELDLITYTGRRIHVHATGHPYYEHGKLTRLYGAFRDISETQRREADLRAQLEVISRQEQAIRAMSTPILQVWEGVVALPVIGTIDAGRAQQIMEQTLSEVVRVRAAFAILDLTGVEEVDTMTADHLLRVTRAVNLLGARGLMCGVRPAVAQTLTTLGVDMAALVAHRNLQDALQACLRALAGRR